MSVYYVYILSNKPRSSLYIGVTNNLSRRMEEHAAGIGSAFTRKYNCTTLLYYEEYADIRLAIARETQLKNWKREWKLDLIKGVNPDLKDLIDD